MVWDTASSLTHVTFVPVLMVSVDGLNEKFLILTVTLDGVGVVGVFEAGAAGVGVLGDCVVDVGVLGVTLELFFETI